jgi:HTH-type transcriptional regulator / antitoxin HipB
MLVLPPYGYNGDRMALRSIRQIAVAVRGRRQDLRLSQAELASRAGVSRKWISEFESGKSTAELGLVLRVLDELGLTLDLAQQGDTQDRPSAVDLDVLLRQLRNQPPTRSSDE